MKYVHKHTCNYSGKYFKLPEYIKLFEPKKLFFSLSAKALWDSSRDQPDFKIPYFTLIMLYIIHDF